MIDEVMFKRAVDKMNSMSKEEFISLAKEASLDKLYISKEDYDLVQLLKYFVNHTDETYLATWIKRHELGDFIPLDKERIELEENPDLSSLVKVCEEYVELTLQGEEDSDLSHCIFREAMKCLYGKDIFKKLQNA
ncbi:MAG: hypothetical protein WC942_10135 [Clostridia bacterium]|jgi:DNA-directed RNA polymerase subunit L